MIAAALCIVAGATLQVLPAPRFTLRWQHTVERVDWEEDYLVAGDWLYLSGARIRGSGAGMEPPPGAIRMGDAWHYRPAQRWLRQVDLARSEFGADYVLCVESACRSLGEVLPLGPTTLRPCSADSPTRR